MRLSYGILFPFSVVTNLFIASVLMLSCGSADKGRPSANQSGRVVDSEQQLFHVDTLLSNLEHPWGMTWLNDQLLLITERRGRILVFHNDQITTMTLEGLPEVYLHGQGGLLDIQRHPDFANNGWIYVSYVKPAANGGQTALARFRLADERINELEELYLATPASSSDVHFGGRIIFDKNHYLYFGLGDRGTAADAQDLSNDIGKIHRLHDDGRIPVDNPFVDDPHARHSIWSYGHHNVQGMAYDSTNSFIYAVEHGPRGGDELNIIEKGRNYGWPAITYGINHDGTIISDETTKLGMEQPIHYWIPSIAPCGLLLYTGDKYPGWKNNLFVAALAGRQVTRIEVWGERYRHEEKLLTDIGRVRQVAQGPNGYIYIITEDPGQLLKLIPEK